MFQAKLGEAVGGKARPIPRPRAGSGPGQAGGRQGVPSPWTLGVACELGSVAGTALGAALVRSVGSRPSWAAWLARRRPISVV